MFLTFMNYGTPNSPFYRSSSHINPTTIQPQSTMLLSSSRWDISHTTDIDAPIDTVWAALIDIGGWEWNRWTKLEAVQVRTGTKGKLKASYEGNDEWKTFDFLFGEVNPDNHVLAWEGTVGPNGMLFSGKHSMRLEEIDGCTRLHHSETFRGLLPRLGLGLPYKTLDRNYLLMNEGLKKFVETPTSQQ